MRRALNFEVEGQGLKAGSKMTWKKQVEEESTKVGLSKVDMLCRSLWIFCVDQIGTTMMGVWPPSVVGDTSGFKILVPLSA